MVRYYYEDCVASIYVESIFTSIYQVIKLPQDEDSGHHILRDPAGKMRKSHRIPWESTGNSLEMEAVFRPEGFWILSGEFLAVACAFR